MKIDFSAAFDRVNCQIIEYKLCSVGIEGTELSVLIQFLSTDHSTLWWMVVEVNWLTLGQECSREVFGPVIVPPVDPGAFFHSVKYADRLCR